MSKDELIELLLVERYSPRPKPEPVDVDTPENVARRRRVLEDLRHDSSEERHLRVIRGAAA